MNKCYVFIGPSGSGKTSIAEKIFRQDQKIITYTTRRPRAYEQQQKDYYFVSSEKFNQMIHDQAFVEWDEYAGNKYGSSKEEIKQKLAKNDCYTILTAPGFWEVRAVFGEMIQPVFVTISHVKLEERLRKRGDSAIQINQRLALFQKDLEELPSLQKLPQLICLTNDGNLSDAVTHFYEQLASISRSKKEY